MAKAKPRRTPRQLRFLHALYDTMHGREPQIAMEDIGSGGRKRGVVRSGSSIAQVHIIPSEKRLHVAWLGRSGRPYSEPGVLWQGQAPSHIETMTVLRGIRRLTREYNVKRLTAHVENPKVGRLLRRFGGRLAKRGAAKGLTIVSL